MKAILKEDIIVRLSIDVGVEVGNIPSGISIDRMRWNGSELVDLLMLRGFYVRHLGDNYFELHAVNVSDSHYVEMRYRDRRKLRLGVDQVPFIAAASLMSGEVKVEKIKAAEAKLHSNLGSRDKQFQDLMALVAALVVYAAEQPPALKTFFEQIAPNIKDAYPAGRYLEVLRKVAKNLKACLSEYHVEVDKINEEGN